LCWVFLGYLCEDGWVSGCVHERKRRARGFRTKDYWIKRAREKRETNRDKRRIYVLFLIFECFRCTMYHLIYIKLKQNKKQRFDDLKLFVVNINCMSALCGKDTWLFSTCSDEQIFMTFHIHNNMQGNPFGICCFVRVLHPH